MERIGTSSAAPPRRPNGAGGRTVRWRSDLGLSDGAVSPGRGSSTDRPSRVTLTAWSVTVPGSGWPCPGVGTGLRCSLPARSWDWSMRPSRPGWSRSPRCRAGRSPTGSWPRPGIYKGWIGPRWRRRCGRGSRSSLGKVCSFPGRSRTGMSRSLWRCARPPPVLPQPWSSTACGGWPWRRPSWRSR